MPAKSKHVQTVEIDTRTQRVIALVVRYRCGECDSILEEGERRCPNCNKFGSRIVGIECPECGEFIEEEQL